MRLQMFMILYFVFSQAQKNDARHIQISQQIRVIHKLDTDLRYSSHAFRLMKCLNYLNPFSLFCCRKRNSCWFDPHQQNYLANTYENAKMLPKLTDFIHAKTGSNEQEAIPLMDRESVTPELQCQLDALWIRYAKA